MQSGPPRAALQQAPWVTLAVCAAAAVRFAVAPPGPGATATVAGLLEIIGAGARSTALVTDAGEGWRLLTCHFVHTSWLHLAFNLVFLFPVGAALEQVLLLRDYAVLLLAIGLGASVASLLGTPQVSAGASGLVFGVLGAAVGVGLRHGSRLPRRVRIHFGGWVLPFLLIVLAVTAGRGGVDHCSHIGGLVTGLSLGLALPLRGDQRCDWWRPVAAGAFAAALVWGAPVLATEGRGSTRVHLDDGSSIAVPPGWRARFGPVGEIEFTSAGGLVVLGTDTSPPGTTTERRDWYTRARMDALSPAGWIDDLSSSPTQAVVTDRTYGSMVRYAFSRDGVPMVRDVFFLAPRTVLSLELPRAWAGKYDETRAEIVGSIHPSPHRPS